LFELGGLQFKIADPVDQTRKRVLLLLPDFLLEFLLEQRARAVNVFAVGLLRHDPVAFLNVPQSLLLRLLDLVAQTGDDFLGSWD